MANCEQCNIDGDSSGEIVVFATSSWNDDGYITMVCPVCHGTGVSNDPPLGEWDLWQLARGRSLRERDY